MDFQETHRLERIHGGDLQIAQGHTLLGAPCPPAERDHLQKRKKGLDAHLERTLKALIQQQHPFEPVQCPNS